MAAPTVLPRHALILTPITQTRGHTAQHLLRQPYHTAKAACRTALQHNVTPVCPLVWYTGFLSPAEYMMDAKRLTKQWLKRCDRIWLHTVPGEEDYLDHVTYDILEDNLRLPRSKKSSPRAGGRVCRLVVSRLYTTNHPEYDYMPVPIDRLAMQDLLAQNVTSVVSQACA